MSAIQTVTLELLRAGPAHNQLLSPLTPYLALCGEEGPVTLHVDLEHRELLNRLERLRYVEATGTSKKAIVISEKMREAEVQELGDVLGRILSGIPTLNAEIGRAQASPDEMIHVRLVLSGSELGLIPFEIADSPQGFPGEGNSLLLQSSAPVTLTREVRRGRPMNVRWDRKPRILFISAAPGGLTVPTRAHVHAIRMALEPWVRWAPNPEQRKEEVAEHVTVLTDASLECIREACASDDYTHVHVLAHGTTFENAGERRYGLALCSSEEPTKQDVVDGKRLAQALQTTKRDGRGRSEPSVVTLMTCDSGNVGSVLIPGGSIAHDLHHFGIPWVFASQFPLTKRGSVTIAEVLYLRLLRGDDPRLVAHGLRHRLKTDSASNHDWASLVAYAAFPPNFEHQVMKFRDRQRRRAVDIAFDKAERSQEAAGAAEDDERLQQQAFTEIQDHLDAWEEELPVGDSLEDRVARAECYGVRAASCKRKAELLFKQGNQDEAERSLVEARAWYEKAVRVDANSFWTATQVASLDAVLEKPQNALWRSMARFCASQSLANASAEAMAWARSSLAELEMLEAAAEDPDAAELGKTKQEVKTHCRAIVELMGPESFPVFATRRQFERYLEWWDRDEWREVAQAAVNELTPHGRPPDRSALPPERK